MIETIESYLAYISGLIAILSFFFLLWKEVIQPFSNYRSLRKSKFTLKGEWLSSWEPKSRNEPEWVNERIEIRMTGFGRVRIRNTDNNGGYDFYCLGRLYKTDGNRHIRGVWHSLDSKNGKSGRFLLMIQKNGYMWGNFWGPNSQNVDMTGGWIVARDEYDLKQSRYFYEKGYISDENARYLKRNKIRLKKKSIVS